MTTKIFTTSLLSIAVSSALLTGAQPVLSNDLPVCVSISSDPDGDGYGWEQNRTCLVMSVNAGNGGNAIPVCADGDESDPDDDGWGWENNRSCVVADDGPDDNDDDEDDEDEGEFDEARLFFELNDTDGDLGLHGMIDGEDWVHLEIDDPLGQELFDLKLDGQLRVQQLTELFFESNEPNFDNLDPSDFFARFPEGQYEIEATLGNGGELSSESTVTHLLPAPAANVTANGLPISIGCETDIPIVSEPVTIAWDPVTMSHPTLGRTGEPVNLMRYELVVEVDEVENAEFLQLLQPDQTSATVPTLPSEADSLFKVEVKAREENDNQTNIEGCFEVQ